MDVSCQFSVIKCFCVTTLSLAAARSLSSESGVMIIISRTFAMSVSHYFLLLFINAAMYNNEQIITLAGPVYAFSIDAKNGIFLKKMVMKYIFEVMCARVRMLRIPMNSLQS